MTMIPDHSRCGKVIYDLLSGYLAQHRHVQEPCLESIAKDIAVQKEVIDDNMLLPLRQLVLQTFTTHGIPFWITRPSLAPWRYLDFCVWTTTTCLGSFSRGPRSGRCLWFRDCAPAGIVREFTELQDVIPTGDDDQAKIQDGDVVTDYGHSFSWAAVFGLTCRCIQAMFCTTAVEGIQSSAKMFFSLATIC